MREWLSRLLVVSLLVGLLLPVSAAGAAQTYDLQPTATLEVPDRTLSAHGETWPIRTIGLTDQGDATEVTVRLPTETTATVAVTSFSGDLVRSTEVQTSGTHRLATESLAAGTYTITLSVDGEIRDVQLLLISGRAPTVTAPAQVDSESYIPVSVTLAASSPTPHRVDVVVYNESAAWRVQATRIGTGEYSAIVDEPLAEGSYAVYAATRSERRRNTTYELTGASAPQPLTVGEPSTPTTTPPSTAPPPEPTAPPSSGSGSAPVSSAAPTTTVARSPSTAAPTQTVTTSADLTETDRPTRASETAGRTEPTTASATATTSDPTPPTTTARTGPTGPALALLVGGGALLVLGRRS